MKRTMLAVAGALLLGACATPSTEVGIALFNDTVQPLMVTGNTGTKVGRACAKNYLGLVITGDMSVEAAKKDGKITQVASVNKEVKGYALYAEVCTVVTGR
ncbi:MAG: TRL-like family protein [Elusimicrobiaceae bacterium]|nr:TRL-like family protein [Elusimicrobiaceae bacterium]MBP5616544.1 TRL-like family protein [Elusimicrobiaceae bacterium]